MSQPNGYGTTAGLHEAGSDRHNASEEQPLINGIGSSVIHSRTLTGRMRKAARAEIRRDWADVVLICCYVITGLLDSASISIWGSFVSMQTGNTVYIGLGLSSPGESNRWIKSGTSLLSFCIGSLVFSRFHRFFSPKRRATPVASFAAQALLCGLAAAIVSFGPGGYGPNDIRWDVLLPIALVAFQACGQAVTSRALKYNALTSVVLTSIYCDLFSDVDLFRVDNVERNRRVSAPLMLLLGAFLGGLFAHSSLGVAGALWFATALKALVVIVWLVWPGDEPNHEE
ncbi:hypothetical protein BD289DRAFT_479627 [Coniella lustricola]|uniref:DUF1275 domain protein n=1 Tax=Coniella lustricola TaxID=2025994 RepID=A0A2T3AIQ3_9PEZI|nr:hypothetical protein BD289DRAFT_479627 [Coniella lustricola]